MVPKNIVTQKVKKQTSKNDNFKLSDENVMEFFLEYDKHNKENRIRIYTDFGNIEIELFLDTKFHRSNFIYLTKKNYFEGTQFYRVINNFVIQAGNSDNRKISQKRKEIGRYLLPNDLDKGYTHKRGMISMPSSLIDNPYKMASPFEFFIVQNRNGALFFIVMTMSFNAIQNVILIFPDERPVFLREANNNMYSVSAYFWAKIFSEFPSSLLTPTIFGGIIYYLIGFSQADWYKFPLFCK